MPDIIHSEGTPQHVLLEATPGKLIPLSKKIKPPKSYGYEWHDYDDDWRSLRGRDGLWSEAADASRRIERASRTGD